jgi:putative endonuclease
MFTIYAIKSSARKYIYVGMTSDFDRRFSEHNTGRNKTTRPYKPFQVLYTEQRTTRAEARKREQYLKSGIGKEFLKSFVA